jgi:fructose-1,6-bisphosphatase/inositol monophosphatase family enzyme
MLMVREAGGIVSDAAGREKQNDEGAVLAGNQPIHTELAALLSRRATG